MSHPERSREIETTAAQDLRQGMRLLFEGLKKILRRRGSISSPGLKEDVLDQVRIIERPESSGEKLIHSFITTYVDTDQFYDDSFSIDSSDGAFLGECGVATIKLDGYDTLNNFPGLFDVWLFEKNGTETQVVILEPASGVTSDVETKLQKSRSDIDLTNRLNIAEGQTTEVSSNSLTIKLTITDVALNENGKLKKMTCKLDVYKN